MAAEDYSILGQSIKWVPSGESYKTRAGVTKQKTKMVNEYKTPVGKFEPDAWKAAALTEIERQGETELLEKVKGYVRRNCAWLHKETDIEEYAIDCLCKRLHLK